MVPINNWIVLIIQACQFAQTQELRCESRHTRSTLPVQSQRIIFSSWVIVFIDQRLLLGARLITTINKLLNDIEILIFTGLSILRKAWDHARIRSSKFAFYLLGFLRLNNLWIILLFVSEVPKLLMISLFNTSTNCTGHIMRRGSWCPFHLGGRQINIVLIFAQDLIIGLLAV